MTELKILLKENASLIRELKYNVKEKAKFIEMLATQLSREEEKVCELVEALELFMFACGNTGYSMTREVAKLAYDKGKQALAKVEGKE